MNDRKSKFRDWPTWLLIFILGFVLLGQQNRFYRANDNWICTGKSDFAVIGAIVVLLLLLWGLLAIKTARTTLCADGLVIVAVLSCAANRFTMVSAIYLVALLIGIVVCEWVAFLRLDSRQVANLLYCVIGCAAIMAVTNLARLWFGWTMPFTQPQDWFHYGSSERLSLWFGNPNDLGCVMAVAAVLSVWLMKKDRGRLLRSGAIVLFCVFFKVLLETYSRGAMVGFSVGLILYLARPGWKTRAVAPLLCILTVTLCSFGNVGGYSARLKSTANIREERSISSRLIVWRESLKMIKDHPVFGVGLGNFGNEFASQYRGERRLPGYSTAMNNILTLGAECGVVSVLLYLSLIASALGACAVNWGEGEDHKHVLVSVLCVLVVCGFFTYSLCKIYYCISWLIIGLLIMQKCKTNIPTKTLIR
ncbi:MAG: O-antigen ligase family protein [Armatimonadota bacterium]|nr:O-antigen ligase family protein [bacterium]